MTIKTLILKNHCASMSAKHNDFFTFNIFILNRWVDIAMEVDSIDGTILKFGHYSFGQW